MRRDAMQPALHEDLMERVLASENMRRAWKRVKANKGAPGIDGMRIEDFAEFARLHWPAFAKPCVMAAINPKRCDGSRSRSRAGANAGWASPPWWTG